MHVCSAPLGNPPPCTSCLYFHCFPPLKTAQVLRYTLWTLGSATDHGEWLPAKGKWSSTTYAAISQKWIAGQHWRWKTCNILLQEPVLTAAEGKIRHDNAFQGYVCTTTPLIMFMTQRGMVLDSRITNRAFQCVMAQETKLCILVWN